MIFHKPLTSWIYLLFVLLFLILCLCACDGGGSGTILRYDLASGVTNLDPQFAQDQQARMLISNTMECLFTQSSDGRIANAMAKDYTVSEDGKVYTFILRQDGQWRDVEGHTSPVTAQDFAFALKRLFSPEAVSPFAPQLFNIKNAQSVSRGTAPMDSLGVEAIDDYTLRIFLNHPDASLPVLLASSWAAPCNEAFFQETKARYGLSLQHLQFNGPFYIRSWDNQQAILLRRNPAYYRQTQSLGANFYIPSAIAKTDSSQTADPIQRFFEGKTDAAPMPAAYLESAVASGGAVTAFANIAWTLTVNHDHAALSNVELRRAIAYSLDRDAIAHVLKNHQTPTQVLVPPAVPLGEHMYREEAGSTSPQGYSQDLARRSINAYRQQNSVPRVLELLCTEDTQQLLLAGMIQRYIQQSLGISIRVVKLSDAALEQRVSSGDYQLALYAFSPAYPSPESVLSLFHSTGTDNVANYQNPRYDQLLENASISPLDEQAEAYSHGEQLLLSDAATIPLYFETSYFVSAPGVSGVRFSPFLSGLRLE